MELLVDLHLQAQVVHQVLQVRLVYQVQVVYRLQVVLQVHPELQALQVVVVHLLHRDHQVPLVLQV